MTPAGDFFAELRAAAAHAVDRRHPEPEWALADLTVFRAASGEVLVLVGLGPRTFHTAAGRTAGEALTALYADLGLTPPDVPCPAFCPPPGMRLHVTQQGAGCFARALLAGGRRSRPAQGATPVHALAALLFMLKETP